MNVTRIAHPEIEAISLMSKTVWRSPGQMFYATPKAYELWQETPELRRIQRWDGKRVFFVHEKQETEGEPQMPALQTVYEPIPTTPEEEVADFQGETPVDGGPRMTQDIHIDDDGYVTFETSAVIAGKDRKFTWHLHHEGWEAFTEEIPNRDPDLPIHETGEMTFPSEEDWMMAALYMEDYFPLGEG